MKEKEFTKSEFVDKRFKILCTAYSGSGSGFP